MSKFNRKFNSACSRLAYWQDLTLAIGKLDSFIKASANFTPDDVSTINTIHTKLFECFSLSNSRLQIHGQRIHSLRKEFK